MKILLPIMVRLLCLVIVSYAQLSISSESFIEAFDFEKELNIVNLSAFPSVKLNSQEIVFNFSVNQSKPSDIKVWHKSFIEQTLEEISVDGKPFDIIEIHRLLKRIGGSVEENDLNIATAAFTIILARYKEDGTECQLYSISQLIENPIHENDSYKDLPNHIFQFKSGSGKGVVKEARYLAQMYQSFQDRNERISDLINERLQKIIGRIKKIQCLKARLLIEVEQMKLNTLAQQVGALESLYEQSILSQIAQEEAEYDSIMFEKKEGGAVKKLNPVAELKLDKLKEELKIEEDFDLHLLMERDGYGSSTDSEQKILFKLGQQFFNDPNNYNSESNPISELLRFFVIADIEYLLREKQNIFFEDFNKQATQLLRNAQQEKGRASLEF